MRWGWAGHWAVTRDYAMLTADLSSLHEHHHHHITAQELPHTQTAGDGDNPILGPGDGISPADDRGTNTEWRWAILTPSTQPRLPLSCPCDHVTTGNGQGT